MTRVEPDGIVIRFKGGIVKLPFLELPEETRNKYGYKPEAAQAFAREQKLTEADSKSAEGPPLMTLDAIMEHQVSLEKSTVDVQFDYRVPIIKESDAGWYKSVIGIAGSNRAIMDALVPKAGISWYESLPVEEKALLPQHVFARMEKDESGMYFLRLLGIQRSPDGRFGW